MSKLSTGNWIGVVIFAIVATSVIGFSCYLQDEQPTQKTATNSSISTQRFLELYHHDKIHNLIIMPKHEEHVDVSGAYIKSGQYKNFQSVVNAKQL